MEDYKCGNCTYFNPNKADFFNSDLYYCENKRIYVRPTADGCKELVPDPKKTTRKPKEFQQSGCFFTTLVRDILHMDDDCDLLSYCRNFREKYMKQNYISLLVEYDLISPVVCNNIRNEENKNALAKEVLQNYLIPFINEIKLGNNNTAINIFVNLINYFKNKYQISDVSKINYQEFDIRTVGKARVRAI